MISAVNNNYSTSFGHIRRPENGVSKKQVLAGAATVAAITAGVVYRKPIMKFFKEFSMKKAVENTKNVFNKVTGKAQKEKRYATFSKEEAQIAAHKDYLKHADTIHFSEQQRKIILSDAIKAFENM